MYGPRYTILRNANIKGNLELDSTTDQELGGPAVTALAKLLADVLCPQGMSEPWDELVAMDKSSLMMAVEVLLQHPELLEQARAEITGSADR